MCVRLGGMARDGKTLFVHVENYFFSLKTKTKTKMNVLLKKKKSAIAMDPHTSEGDS